MPSDDVVDGGVQTWAVHTYHLLEGFATRVGRSESCGKC